jgi:hypothetical protein
MSNPGAGALPPVASDVGGGPGGSPRYRRRRTGRTSATRRRRGSRGGGLLGPLETEDDVFRDANGDSRGLGGAEILETPVDTPRRRQRSPNHLAAGLPIPRAANQVGHQLGREGGIALRTLRERIFRPFIRIQDRAEPGVELFRRQRLGRRDATLLVDLAGQSVHLPAERRCTLQYPHRLLRFLAGRGGLHGTVPQRIHRAPLFGLYRRQLRGTRRTNLVLAKQRRTKEHRVRVHSPPRRESARLRDDRGHPIDLVRFEVLSEGGQHFDPLLTLELRQFSDDDRDSSLGAAPHQRQRPIVVLHPAVSEQREEYRLLRNARGVCDSVHLGSFEHGERQRTGQRAGAVASIGLVLLLLAELLDEAVGPLAHVIGKARHDFVDLTALLAGVQRRAPSGRIGAKLPHPRLGGGRRLGGRRRRSSLDHPAKLVANGRIIGARVRQRLPARDHPRFHATPRHFPKDPESRRHRLESPEARDLERRVITGRAVGHARPKNSVLRLELLIDSRHSNRFVDGYRRGRQLFGVFARGEVPVGGYQLREIVGPTLNRPSAARRRLRRPHGVWGVRPGAVCERAVRRQRADREDRERHRKREESARSFPSLARRRARRCRKDRHPMAVRTHRPPCARDECKGYSGHRVRHTRTARAARRTGPRTEN